MNLVKIYYSVPQELILSNVETIKYAKFSDFPNISADTIFIDKIDEKFEKASLILNGSDIIGLDSEWKPTYSKLTESKGLAIFQISCYQKNFIFDCHSLQNEQKFIDLIESLFSNKKIIKIGQSFAGDLKIFAKKFKIKEDAKLNSYLEIRKIFKKFNKDDNKSALSHVVENLFSKNLSKGEQCSNWDMRSLRLSQLHYAAMDSAICLAIYDRFLELAKEKVFTLI